MNSEITLENYPPTVIIYERPEFKDAVSWMILSIAILIVIDIGLFVSNPNLVLPGSLAILVIITPFFINRYAIKKDSVGGESFKMEKTERKSIIYKNKEFSIEEVSFELITRKMNYGNTYLLYMISNQLGEIKLRSDYSAEKEYSITVQLSKYLQLHLGLEIQSVTDVI